MTRLAGPPDGRRPLFVRQLGRTGPIVVLLHGLGASSRFWRQVAEPLVSSARLVCPDLLGFGRSPWPRAAYSLVDHVTALDATIDRLSLGDEPMILGGHSFGAILAVEWAAARPDRFRGVCVISLPVYRSSADARAHIAGLSPLAWATVAQPHVGELICGIMCAGRPFFRAIAPLMMPSLPPDVARDGMLHNWVSYSGSLENVVIEHRVQPAAERLADTRLPIRLLHGADDQVAPLDSVRALATRLGWPAEVLPGRTHHLPLEEPEACVSVLHALLTGER